MARTIKREDVLNALHNLMGHRTSPGGTEEDFVRYVQASFDYCWRYYPWMFSLKKADIAADGLLPTDFDHEGWRRFDGVTEISMEDSIAGLDGSVITWNGTRYVLDPTTSGTVAYQYQPPTLDGTETPFPSAMVVAIGATVLAKQGNNPTRADIQQEWDEWHSDLDRLVGRAENNKPRRIRTRHDVMGTFLGDTGA